MEWNIQGDRPIYTQLVEQVTLAIVSGDYAPGERLPSVRDLAVQAEVNPNTMQRALSQLEEQGLLYTQRTAGRFVTQDTAVIQSAKQRLAARQVEEFLAAEACAGDACTACCGAPARPVILACGPRPMLKGVAALAERYGVPCQVSLEERMGCGVGACLVCACKTADGRMKHVCKDGPVFDSREVDWND